MSIYVKEAIEIQKGIYQVKGIGLTKASEFDEDYVILAGIKDICQTLKNNQILLRGQQQDAEKAISVLGTANASFETVTWKRTIDQVKPYVDYIVTVN